MSRETTVRLIIPNVLLAFEYAYAQCFATSKLLEMITPVPSLFVQYVCPPCFMHNFTLFNLMAQSRQNVSSCDVSSIFNIL